MKKEIQSFLKDLGAFVTVNKPEIYSFEGQRNIDVYFGFLEDQLIIDIQYNPLTERLYDGQVPTLKKFKKMILGSKLNYLLKNYLSKNDEQQKKNQ